MKDNIEHHTFPHSDQTAYVEDRPGSFRGTYKGERSLSNIYN